MDAEYASTHSSIIKGYKTGANITLINTIYIKPQKEPDGSYTPDYIYLVYKDLDTGDIKNECIPNPQYTYYISNGKKAINHNLLYIEKEFVRPVTCKYRDLLKSIAKETNNEDFFYDNIRSGDYKANDRLMEIPTVFNADQNIEDYYRNLFNKLYQNNPFDPTKLYFDIEVNISEMLVDDIPKDGKYPIDAITLVDDNSKNIYTLLLEDYNNKSFVEFKNSTGVIQRMKEFITMQVGGIKRAKELDIDRMQYKIIFFKEEISLLKTMFHIINTIKPNVALAWNIGFDLVYIIDRIRVLGYEPAEIICHPDFNIKICQYFIDHRAERFEERGDYANISSYTIYLDQLITFASRRKGQRLIQSFKLDYVGELVAGVRKLDYSNFTRDLAKLPKLSYETYVFYNICDTIVQYCIERCTDDVNFVFIMTLTTLTRVAKVHRKTVSLFNKGIDRFYNDGYVMGNNVNKHNEKKKFAGAFVADPLLVSDKPKLKVNGKPVNLMRNSIDYDYTAMYPSIIEQNNISPVSMLAKILLPEQVFDAENQFNNDYYDRVVWMVEDLLSTNYLDFAARWFDMPTYEEMYDLVIQYFMMIQNASRGLRVDNPNTGKRYIAHPIADNSKPRLMYRLVDNTKPRLMYRLIERMPKNDGNTSI